MKRPERFPPDDPREWMNRARSNLALAKNRVAEAYLEDLCFEAQQAVEKAIKAMMISRNIEFPYVTEQGTLLNCGNNRVSPFIQKAIRGIQGSRIGTTHASHILGSQSKLFQ